MKETLKITAVVGATAAMLMGAQVAGQESIEVIPNDGAKDTYIVEFTKRETVETTERVTIAELKAQIEAEQRDIDAYMGYVAQAEARKAELEAKLVAAEAEVDKVEPMQSEQGVI